MSTPIVLNTLWCGHFSPEDSCNPHSSEPLHMAISASSPLTSIPPDLGPPLFLFLPSLSCGFPAAVWLPHPVIPPHFPRAPKAPSSPCSPQFLSLLRPLSSFLFFGTWEILPSQTDRHSQTAFQRKEVYWASLKVQMSPHGMFSQAVAGSEESFASLWSSPVSQPRLSPLQWCYPYADVPSLSSSLGRISLSLFWWPSIIPFPPSSINK